MLVFARFRCLRPAGVAAALFAPLVLLASSAAVRADDCLTYDDYLHWTGGVATADSAQAVVVAGDYAYVADGAAGLAVVAIGDPTAPQLVEQIALPGPAYGLAVSGDLLLVAAQEAGLQAMIRLTGAPLPEAAN